MKKLTTFQLQILNKIFKTATTKIHKSHLSNKNGVWKSVQDKTNGVPLFLIDRDHYYPNPANQLIFEYYQGKQVDLSSPEMVKPVLNLKANDVVVDEGIRIGEYCREITDTLPNFCETVKAENPNPLSKYHYAMKRVAKMNPIDRLKFSIELRPIGITIQNVLDYVKQIQLV